MIFSWWPKRKIKIKSNEDRVIDAININSLEKKIKAELLNQIRIQGCPDKGEIYLTVVVDWELTRDPKLKLVE